MKIDFEYTTSYGVFRDALTLPDNHSYTDDELEAMKVSRRDKWIAVVTAPSEDTRVSIDVDVLSAPKSSTQTVGLPAALEL